MVVRALENGNTNLRFFGLNLAVAFPILRNLIGNRVELASALLAICHRGLDAAMLTIGLVVKYDGTPLPGICSKKIALMISGAGNEHGCNYGEYDFAKHDSCPFKKSDCIPSPAGLCILRN